MWGGNYFKVIVVDRLMKNKIKNWQSSLGRPEEKFKEPGQYYSKERVEKYSQSSGMKKAQERIANRILELLQIKGGKILDLGCGVGYTTNVYREKGFEVMGVDKLPRMLEKAREKGLDVKEGDMRELSKIIKCEVEAIVSASALQWISIEEVRNVAREFKKVLKDKGEVIIQFYPCSREEMMRVARQFKREGFKGRIIVDNPDRPKKREIYLVFIKD